MNAAMQQPRSELHLWARWLVEAHGLKVFPLPPLKKGASGLGIFSATDNLEQIDAWWYARPDANVGVTGCLRIDPDTKEGGIEAWRALVAEHGLPRTMTVNTPRGGQHLYFRAPVEYDHNSRGSLPKGIDVRGHDSGYTVGPGSRTSTEDNPNGYYQLIDPTAPIADAPQWLLDMIGRSVVAKITIPALQTIDDQQLDDLRAALVHPAVLMDWDRWHEYGLALLSLGDVGFELFEAYSDMQLGFCDKRSLGPDTPTSFWARHARTKPRTDFRHIFKIAGELGWKNPRRSPERVLGLIKPITPPACAAEATAPTDNTPAKDAAPNFDTDTRGNIRAELPALTFVLGAGQLGQIAYDRFIGQVMLAPNNTNEWRELEDNDYTDFRLRIQEMGFAPVSEDMIRDSIDWVAHRNQFDSAQLWLNGLEWDGTPRVDNFLSAYCGAEDTPYHRAVSRYIWSGLAGRVLEPGCQLDMVVAFVSSQGRRKSTGIRALAPSPEHYTDSLSLQDKDDNFGRLLRGKLIVELAEMARMGEVNAVKAAITRRGEEWVRKYKEKRVKSPRRCMIFATINDEEFLPQDQTGNRRWLPVKIVRLDDVLIARDRDQLWAEGAALWHKGGICYAEAESLAPAQHIDHEVHEVWEETIHRWLTTCPPSRPGVTPLPAPETRKVTIVEILTHALRIEVGRQNRNDAMKAANALRHLGYCNSRGIVNGIRVSYWFKAK